MQIEVIADNKQNTKVNSTIRFVQELPGNGDTRTAKVVVQVVFNDPDSADQFKMNKKYLISIEENE